MLYGHKFDLRLYVVVTSFDPLRVYIYREGLVRFASERYSNEDLSSEEAKYSHLTNYSINKNNEKFVKNDVSPPILICSECRRRRQWLQVESVSHVPAL